MGSPSVLANSPFGSDGFGRVGGVRGVGGVAALTAGAGGGDNSVIGDDGDVSARAGDGSDAGDPKSPPARRCASATVCSTRWRSIGAPNATATCPRLRAV